MSKTRSPTPELAAEPSERRPLEGGVRRPERFDRLLAQLLEEQPRLTDQGIR